ncbi:transposable element Tcb2 transposase [Trichonephila clavipes]|nr:transposable element Tcb2 transposase [Trichonephila clavipes]
MNGRTDLDFFDTGSVTAQRYKGGVLEPYVCLFRGAFDADFIFMNDNAPCRRVVLIDDFLETENIQRMSDEAHFWLNGYVNKQNCRIWNEANPQVYVETPLHPEKLTVWCAFWAGGILLQKR